MGCAQAGKKPLAQGTCFALPDSQRIGDRRDNLTGVRAGSQRDRRRFRERAREVGHRAERQLRLADAAEAGQRQQLHLFHREFPGNGRQVVVAADERVDQGRQSRG